MAAIWKIRCYCNEGGRNEIEKWYGKQSGTVQATFDSAMEYLVEQPREGWVRPDATRLAGNNCSGLYEIRFKADRKQIRPLGFFGPIEGEEFTILICALEKGNEFEPPDACNQAKKRQANVGLNKSKYSCECFCAKGGCFCSTCETPCCQDSQ